MARRGDIEIPIAVDTGGVQKAINNGLIEPVEDAEDALKRLEGTDAGRDIERAMDRAQDSTEDLSRELDSTRRDLDKLGFAAKDAGDDGRRGMDRIKGGASEVQAEIGQNLGEAMSSFRGDLEDVGQIGQDTFGGLAATVAGIGGPGGLIAGLGLGAVAAGVGVVFAEIEKAKQEQSKLNDLVSELAGEYYDAGGAVLDASYLIGRAQEILADPEARKEAEMLKDVLGLDMPTALRALAGDATATEVAQRALTDQTRDLRDSIENGEEGVLGMNAALGAAGTVVERLSTAQGKAATDAEYLSRILFEVASESGTATGKVDDLGNSIVALPGGKEVVIDAATRTAHEDLDAVERLNISTKTVQVHVDRSRYDQFIAGLRNNLGVNVVPTVGKGVPWQ